MKMICNIICCPVSTERPGDVVPTPGTITRYHTVLDLPHALSVPIILKTEKRLICGALYTQAVEILATWNGTDLPLPTLSAHHVYEFCTLLVHYAIAPLIGSIFRARYTQFTRLSRVPSTAVRTTYSG